MFLRVLALSKAGCTPRIRTSLYAHNNIHSRTANIANLGAYFCWKGREHTQRAHGAVRRLHIINLLMFVTA